LRAVTIFEFTSLCFKIILTTCAYATATSKFVIYNYILVNCCLFCCTLFLFLCYLCNFTSFV